MASGRPAVVIALVLAAIVATFAAHAQSRAGAEQFDPVAVVNGITISREACWELQRQETAIWVVAGGQGACMRYYAAGLASAPKGNPVAALWLNGDVLGPHGSNADKRQKGFGPAEMIALETRLQAEFRVPSIYLGRPGTYGSAGKHFALRGRQREADLVSATLDALKARYGIATWALGGHSGGGTLVGAMLARRSDLRCAVISSGAVAYRAYLAAHGLSRPDRFDPSAALDHVPADPARRIFVIGDPRETNVPFAIQTLYFDGLVARHHAAWLVPLRRATDDRHHDLVDFGELATWMCAANAGTDAILSALKTLPDPPPRRMN